MNDQTVESLERLASAIAPSEPLTDKEIYMLAATAAAEAARWYQPHDRPYQMYMALSEILDGRAGELVEGEFDAACKKLLSN